MIFEWNDAKAVSNLIKYGVSFEEARSVFLDEAALQFFDQDESLLGEDRFLLLGMSSKGRLLLVCHCERGKGDRIRIISARQATRREARFYGGTL